MHTAITASIPGANVVLRWVWFAPMRSGLNGASACGFCRYTDIHDLSSVGNQPMRLLHNMLRGLSMPTLPLQVFHLDSNAGELRLNAAN
jgi:hypothetical protein